MTKDRSHYACMDYLQVLFGSTFPTERITEGGVGLILNLGLRLSPSSSKAQVFNSGLPDIVSSLVLSWAIGY